MNTGHVIALIKALGGEGAVSPTITVTDIEGGHRLTITDVNGTETVDVMDGATGPKGEDGEQGPQGAQGPAGPGVPAGGSAGQVLTKSGSTDYAAAWQDPPSGALVCAFSKSGSSVSCDTAASALLDAFNAGTPVFGLAAGAVFGINRPVMLRMVRTGASGGASDWIYFAATDSYADNLESYYVSYTIVGMPLLGTVYMWTAATHEGPMTGPQGEQGEMGPLGPSGADGRGIDSIYLSGGSDIVIEYTDGDTDTIQLPPIGAPVLIDAGTDYPLAALALQTAIGTFAQAAVAAGGAAVSTMTATQDCAALLLTVLTHLGNGARVMIALGNDVLQVEGYGSGYFHAQTNYTVSGHEVFMYFTVTGSGIAVYGTAAEGRPGLPTGGSAGQALVKTGASDFAAGWASLPTITYDSTTQTLSITT